MTFFLTRVLVQITPNTLTNIYVILNGQFKHILKAFLPYLKIFKCFTRSVTTNMIFFTLFSFSYAQNIIFLSIVINSTNLHHKRVPVVLLVDYCLLLTEENSALHSYFYLLRMAGLHRNAPILIPKSYLFGTLRRHIRRVWSSHGSYFGETQSSQNTHGETKRARYAAEAYQKRCD